MIHLLADNSNGRTKFALCRDGMLLPERRILATSDLSRDSVRTCLSGWSYEAAVICSVVPSAQPILRQALSPVPTRFLTAGNAPRVDFQSYPGHSTLGADRVADALSLTELGRYPAIVIDAGTAITMDSVALQNGVPTFLGGIIAPGLRTMAAALHTGTAQLPQVQTEIPQHAIGRNTAEAMQSGLVLGLRGMVREMAAACTAELGQRPYIIATGGDAPLLRELLPDTIDAADPLLTLRGLAVAARLWAAAE